MSDIKAPPPAKKGHRKLALTSAVSACAVGGSVAAALTLQGMTPVAATSHSYRSNLEVAQGRGPIASEGHLSPNGAYWEVPGTLFAYQRMGEHIAAPGQRPAALVRSATGTRNSAVPSSPSTPGLPLSGSGGGGGGTGTTPVSKSGGTTCVSFASLPSTVQALIKAHHLSIDGVKVQLKNTKKGLEVCGKLPKSLTKKHNLPVPLPIPTPSLPKL